MIFRIGRRPTRGGRLISRWPGGRIFGNRFDDPDGTYRVLYGSSQRLGCCPETLMCFASILTLGAELAGNQGEDDFLPPGGAVAAFMGGKQPGGIGRASGRGAHLAVSGLACSA
jgi:hypothetical protein